MPMKKVSTGFAQRLKALREARGLTQSQLAEAAGLNLHGLTKLEQGVGEPHWPTVLALADALGCQPNDFIGEAGASAGSEPRRGRPPKSKGPAVPGPTTDGKPGAAPKRPRGRPRKGE
jgi:transcriptional regulator with XRE-family HTH domain